MFLSTQSVSRPKRDSIYSFLRHFGPFGSIATAIFSENPGCSNSRFLKKEYSHASTAQFYYKIVFLGNFSHPLDISGGVENCETSTKLYQVASGNFESKNYLLPGF